MIHKGLRIRSIRLVLWLSRLSRGSYSFSRGLKVFRILTLRLQWDESTVSESGLALSHNGLVFRTLSASTGLTMLRIISSVSLLCRNFAEYPKGSKALFSRSVGLPLRTFGAVQRLNLLATRGDGRL